MKKSTANMTDLEKWAVFFQYASEPKYRDRVNDVIETKEELKMAGELLRRKRGINRRNIEIARNMLSDDEPISKIIKYTGLTEVEINRLLR